MSQSDCWVWYSRCYFRLLFKPVNNFNSQMLQKFHQKQQTVKQNRSKRKQQQQSQQWFWKIPADLWDATQSLFLFSVAFWFLENQLGPIVHAVKHFTHSVKPRIEKPDSMERCLGLLQLGEESFRMLHVWMLQQKDWTLCERCLFSLFTSLISTPIAPVQTYLIKWLLLPAHFFLV